MPKFLYLIVILLLLGCSNDDLDPSNIVGKWKLVERLADPGDGSGVFIEVESNKTLTFLDNDTFSSENGVVCFMSADENGISTGTFSRDEKQIYPNSCDSFARIVLDYSIENSALIVRYSCIEACAEKYKKVE